jgi:hypothetical protein
MGVTGVFGPQFADGIIQFSYFHESPPDTLHSLI